MKQMTLKRAIQESKFGFLLKPEIIFMMSAMSVNGLNYLYNIIMGRMLGPEAFADVALIITMLLMLSFLATTFQVVTTKFEVEMSDTELDSFHSVISRMALTIGILVSIVLVLSSTFLHKALHTSSPWVFIIFAIGVPFYFVLSINRGIFQGNQKFEYLSITYISEVLVKLIFSFVLIYFGLMHSAIAVSFAVLASLFIAFFPTQLSIRNFQKKSISPLWKKRITTFFILTLSYELTQVLINSSDIFLVKMYFDDHHAGLYASLALVGRVVYFITWMLVMIALPKIIEKEKTDGNSFIVFIPYLSGIAIMALFICSICFIFSTAIMELMFGPDFTEIHLLLYKYAIATSLFALSNVLIYFSLSIEKYIPIALALLASIVQIVGIVWFHRSLEMVVEVQIIVMSFLLIAVSIYTFLSLKKF